MGILLASIEARAGGSTDGRFTFTFQDLKSGSSSQQSFLQSYRLTARDKVFSTNDLALSFYLSSAKNLTTSRTTLRYRGQLELSNQYYSLSSLFTPKQKTTPLESEMEREALQNQHTLNIHIPNLPVVQLSYEKNERYADGKSYAATRAIRGDIRYRYKILTLSLNRWNEKVENRTTSSTTVTGGSARLAESFGVTNVSAGYEYQFTESSPAMEFERRVSNHTVSSLVSSRYKNYITGSLSMITRWLALRNKESFDGRTDEFSFRAAILPSYPLHLDVFRDYRYKKQDGSTSLSDYMSVQISLAGNINQRTFGRAYTTRRFNLDGTNSVLPANLYFVSASSKLYRGIDIRSEINVSEREDVSLTIKRFQTSSLFDLYLKPRKDFKLNPQIHFIKFSNQFGLLKNDRMSYGVTGTYSYTNSINMNLGFEARRNIITSGAQYENTSLTMNFGLRTRVRSSFNISYGWNNSDYLNDAPTPGTEQDSKAKTLIVQTQYWLFQRGAVSLNYTGSTRGDNKKGRYLNLNYTQYF